VEDANDRSDSARDGRHETPLEQLDRNWADLLQELRVAQTGVQLLTGFLLTLPFQSRFADLSDLQRSIYLFTMAASVIATAFLIGPVSLHRMVFRRHVRRATVQVGHRLAIVGIALLGLAMVGVVLLIFSVVLGDQAGVVAASIIAVMLVVLWFLLPLYVRNTHTEPTQGRHPRPTP
jgi:hypothetical protein